MIIESIFFIYYIGVIKSWYKWVIYLSVKYYKIVLENFFWKDDFLRDAKLIIEFKKRYKYFLV